MSVSQTTAEGVEGHFTASDGATIYSRTWEADPAHHVGTIIAVHGYGEHCGRYDHIARRFNEAGYSVYSYDHRGHGKSPGTRGVITGFSRLPDDLDAFVAQLGPAIEDKPLFYFGHSMGALVLAHYAVLYEPTANGLIFSSGLFKPSDDVSPILKALSPVVSTLLPFIPVHSVSTVGLSHEVTEVQKYEADPLVHHGSINARTGHELVTAMNAIQASADRLTIPALFIHGKEDAVAEWEGSQMLYARCASEDKHLSLYEDAYHEIFNDTEKERFFGEVLDWIAARR